MQTHKLESILNKNSVFNLIFYLSFEFECRGMGDRKYELWQGLLPVCVCVSLGAALSMPEYGNKKWRDVVVLEGGATNWVYKFAAETCPTIKQTYCQGPASMVPFQ